MSPPQRATPAPSPLLTRLYALALLCYPRRQRRRFAAEMLLVLEESWREQCLDGGTPAPLFWLRAFRGLLASSLALRLAGGRTRQASGHAASPAGLATLAGPATSTNRSHRPGRSPATRIEALMESIAQDVKHALRMIRRSPTFSAAVVLTLMLGIGANAAIFSVLEGVVLSPLPYPDADRLFHVWTQFPEQGIDRFEVSRAEFSDYAAESRLFEAMFAYQVVNVTISGVAEPMRARAAVASAGIWEVLGGRATLGRPFGPHEDRPGHDRVIVLDHGFWQQTFGGRDSIIGESLMIDGFPYEVIGVMAPGFDLPEGDADLYTPLAIDTGSLAERSGHGLAVIGRSEAGVDLNDLLAEMAVVSGRWAEQYAHAHPLTANRVSDQVIGDARGPLFLLGTAVGFVLLIACANVAGLLMARTSGRQREIGVRAALGARPPRLVRQILTEGVLLAVAGGALGLPAAAAGTRFLLRLEPGDLPRLQEISIDATVLAFVAVVSLLAGIGLAAVPAWRTARVEAGAALAATPRTTSGAARQGFQRFLVTFEVALAVVLVIGSGLLLRSFATLTRVDPGLQPNNLITTRIGLPFGSYRDADDAEAFWNRLRAELGAAPGFRSVALVRALPIRDQAFIERFLREGESEANAAASGHVPSFDWQMAFPGYFQTLGIPLAAGRDFTELDRTGAPRVAIVSESLVRRYFAGRDPVGARIRILASNPHDIPFEIIGVAGDVRHDGLDREPPIQIFTPYAQLRDYRPGLLWTAAVVVHTDLDPASAAAGLRRIVGDIDPDLPLARISTMNEVLRESVARPRFITLLLALFSALALLLALVGVYGVVAYGVAQRQREMGIRMALGAQRCEVLRLVLREGMRPAAIGIGIGVAAALFLTRLMESVLFGVTATDPATFAVVTGMLGLAALVAAWIPARRATRLDPVRALRGE